MFSGVEKHTLFNSLFENSFLCRLIRSHWDLSSSPSNELNSRRWIFKEFQHFQWQAKWTIINGVLTCYQDKKLWYGKSVLTSLLERYCSIWCSIWSTDHFQALICSVGALLIIILGLIINLHAVKFKEMSANTMLIERSCKYWINRKQTWALSSIYYTNTYSEYNAHMQ